MGGPSQYEIDHAEIVPQLPKNGIKTGNRSSVAGFYFSYVSHLQSFENSMD
jgi:hypothetical protein